MGTGMEILPATPIPLVEMATASQTQLPLHWAQCLVLLR